MTAKKVLIAALVGLSVLLFGITALVGNFVPDGRPAPTTPAGHPLAPTAEPRTAGATDGAAWAPPEPGAPWQIVLDGPSPKKDKKAQVVEVDWETPARQVRTLNNRGVYTVCYFSAGSWERWRPDADDFPAEVLGSALDDWPGERYVNLADLETLLPLWEARIDACAEAGFDAIDPDNIDAYANRSGFDLTQADAVEAFLALADAAHERGLGIALKNSPEIVTDVVAVADLAVVEECLQYDFCGDFDAFVDAGKPVLVVEYRGAMTLKKMCGRDDTAGMSLLLQRLALDRPGKRCAS